VRERPTTAPHPWSVRRTGDRIAIYDATGENVAFLATGSDTAEADAQAIVGAADELARVKAERDALRGIGVQAWREGAADMRAKAAELADAAAGYALRSGDQKARAEAEWVARRIRALPLPGDAIAVDALPGDAPAGDEATDAT
jgi:hypothetical protein